MFAGKFSFRGKKTPPSVKIIDFKPLHLKKLIGIKLVIKILSITESSSMYPISAIRLVLLFILSLC